MKYAGRDVKLISLVKKYRIHMSVFILSVHQIPNTAVIALWRLQITLAPPFVPAPAAT